MPATLQFASALSTADRAEAAVEQVVAEVTRTLAPPVDLAVVFATAPLVGALGAIGQRLRAALRPGVLLGASAGGVIGVKREVERGPGLAVLAARLPGVALHPFCYQQIDWSGGVESVAAMRQRVAGDMAEPRAILLLPDPFSTPLLRFLPALSHSFAGTPGAGVAGVPVVGGMASSGAQPGGNALLFDGQVLREGAVGLTLGGRLDVRCTVSQGCRPIGRPYVITRSQRHVVQELGGRCPLAVIREMTEGLEPADRALIASHGLFVGRVIDEYKPHFGRGDFLIRGLVGMDENAGYVAIGDPQVRVGQTIQFHVRDQQTAREDFALLLEGQKLHGPAAGALLCTCNGRGTRLFDQPDTDATLVHEALGPTPLAGFFAAGEIGPVGDQAFVHGHTASLVVFREPGG